MQNAWFTALFIGACLSVPAHAAGDAVAGQAVFKKCTACHAADKPQNKVGPHLVAIIGRPGASVGDYGKYSDVMKNAGSGGLVWDEATLATYLAAPKAFMPGTKMAFAGLKKPEDIDDLLAYFRSLPAQ